MRDVRITNNGNIVIEYESKNIRNWCYYTHKILRNMGLENVWQTEEIGEKNWNTLIKLMIKDRGELDRENKQQKD